MNSHTRRFTLATIAAASGTILSAPAIHAEPRIRWRMATSWPKNLPGLGTIAAYIARRVSELTEGKFEIQQFAAGEIVPALQVIDAVGAGTVEMGHSTALYWQGKNPATNFFTTIPFGPAPIEHLAWLQQGGGNELWEELYKDFNVKPCVAGNIGPCMAGWFKREVKSVKDFSGLKIRSQGLGGEIWARLGALPVSVAAGDILPSLSSGTIDAVEFLGPMNDISLGLYKPAPFYYTPSFNKPNSASEASFNLTAWEKLPSDYKAILELVCVEAHTRGLAEAESLNANALRTLVGSHQVQLRRLSPEIISTAKKHSEEVMANLAASSPMARKISESLQNFRENNKPWRKISLGNAISLESNLD